MIKNISYYSSALLITSLLSFISVPIFTRFLTPDDYGVLAIFFLFGGTLTNLLSLGIQGATIMFYYKLNDNDFKTLNFTNLCFLFITFFIGAIFLIFVDDYIVINIFDNKISKNIIYYSYIYGCIFKFYTYFHNQFIHQKRARTFFYFAVSNSILFTILSIFLLIFFSYGLYSRIYSAIIITLVLLPIILFFQNKYLNLRFSLLKLKKSLTYSYPYLPGSIVNLVNDSFDKTMLTNIKGTADVGIYHIAQSINSIHSQVINVIQTAWTPFFLENAVNIDDNKKKIILERYYDIIFIFNIASLLICLFSYEIVILLTTKDFHFASYLIPIFVSSSFFSYMTSSLSKPQFMVSEKLIYNLISTIIYVVINVLLNIFLIPKYGVLGAIIALYISTIVSSCVSLYFSQKFFYLPISYFKIFKNYILFIISLIPIYFLIYTQLNLIILFFIKLMIIIIYLFLSTKLDLLDMNKVKIYSLIFMNKIFNNKKIKR